MAKIDPLLTALVPVLADTCAIHTPIRRWPHGPHHVAIERMLDFREHGGLVYEVGGDAAERKRGERLATAWERAGLVVFGRQSGRRIRLRLTDHGDWRLRALCGCYGRHDMAVSLFALQCHVDAGFATGGFVPETALAGQPWGGSTASSGFTRIEDLMSPAVCRHLATWNSDCDGRVSYALTAAGREWLKSPPAGPARLPHFSPTAGRRFTDLFVTELQRLEAAEPRRTRVWILMSAGCYPAAKPIVPAVLTDSLKPRTLTDFIKELQRLQRTYNAKET